MFFYRFVLEVMCLELSFMERKLVVLFRDCDARGKEMLLLQAEIQSSLSHEKDVTATPCNTWSQNTL